MDLLRQPGRGRADRVHGSGTHAAVSRSTVDRVHPAHTGRRRAPGGGHAGAAGGRRHARAPMVAGGGHRHGGAAPEKGEGKGETKRRSTAHPGSTAMTKTATGAEEGGGEARVDGVDGAPAVGDRNGEVDEVGEDAAKPKEAAPRWEVVRGDNGGGPELGGDARVAGGPARQRRARGERPDGPWGEEREGEGDGPSRPKKEREGKGTF
uniref:Pr1-like protein n=1 Tax=Oryza sativa subsp. japonica TaxID=39947 RepID=Q5Z450_ORYSJ|nr:pr1-like protein [Oryza sativa Japonica Group]BAD62463.1 pr1-like protein [Oryza sativa Japonica Group]